MKNWKNPNENKTGKILARSKVLSTLKSFLPQDFTSYIGKPLVGDWLLKVKQGYRSRPPCPHKSSWYFQQEIFSQLLLFWETFGSTFQSPCPAQSPILSNMSFHQNWPGVYLSQKSFFIKLPSTGEPVNRNLTSSELQLYFYLPCFSCSCYQRIQNQVPYFLKLCIIQPKDWTNTYVQISILIYYQISIFLTYIF